jgi:hypothetical protein
MENATFEGVAVYFHAVAWLWVYHHDVSLAGRP